MKWKSLIINFCIIIIVFLIIITGIILFKKYYNNHLNEKDISKFIEENYKNVNLGNDINNDSKQELDLEYKGYKVLGVLTIPKINLNYAVIDPLNNKDAALNVSVIKFSGGNLNDYGNVTLAGHNYYDTTMFAKLHLLNISDRIEIMDNTKATCIYSVYDKYTVSPDDTSCLKTNDNNVKELTLITCTKGNSKRLVIKAKEIK